MNANELADMLEDTESYFSQDIDDRDYGMICKASTVLRQQQAEIERLTTKNLEWLANWNEQQAEIEALKKSINEALASIPAYGEQGFYFEHHDINGEYLGHSSIHAEDVVQRIEAILIKAQEK